MGKCFRVSTDATSREGLELVTADLWLDSPEYVAVMVTFYPSKPTTLVFIRKGCKHGMEPSPRQLESLTRNPREGLAVELKGWLDLNQGEHKADLVNAILALANHGQCLE